MGGEEMERVTDFLGSQAMPVLAAAAAGLGHPLLSLSLKSFSTVIICDSG